MARPARFTPDDILDSAAVIAEQRWRDATVADVAAALKTPAGSIYYRFPTRDALFGSLWLRAVRRFHVGYLEALDEPDPRVAAVQAAASIVRFCRDQPLDAVAMTLYRRGDLVAALDGDLASRVLSVNDVVDERLRGLADDLFGTREASVCELVRTACVESPYGLVRRHLRSNDPVPAWLEGAARAATSAILQHGYGKEPDEGNIAVRCG